VHLLRLVFLDRQKFAKFVMARAADVFVEGHRLVRLKVEGLVSFDEIIFLKTVPYFPLIAIGSPLFVLRNRGHWSAGSLEVTKSRSTGDVVAIKMGRQPPMRVNIRKSKCYARAESLCPGGMVESYPAFHTGLLSTFPPGQRGCTRLETIKCRAR
jgi:hypothetical protein